MNLFKKAKNIEIYTSYYHKMFARKKDENDVYIQVSRTLGQYGRFRKYREMIDEDWGEIFGNFAVSLEAYEQFINKKGLRKFYRHLKDLEDKRLFLLCFENMDEKYTRQDEIRYQGQVKAGENKRCHRTILAKTLNEKYGLGIKEFQEVCLILL